ncbi:hypothetical protein SNE40_013603 [Patella caerulea]|uniref:non-specific serine/threonine protein kinase n=1 Tax=Patella caerulea TaxID=87958 RepID=A0AAN8JBX9_PATCE
MKIRPMFENMMDSSDDDDDDDDDDDLHIYNCEYSNQETDVDYECDSLRRLDMADMGSTRLQEEYIYDLPYSVTRAIYGSMDADKSWEALASEAGYTFENIKRFELEYLKGGSPCKALLWDWGTQNITAKQLYFKLRNINRRREMQILEHYFRARNVNGVGLKETENEEDARLDSLNSTLASALPRPSQKHKTKQEKVVKEESEVNFNQPSSQIIGSRKLPLRSMSSVEKDKHYDDKIIPGQESAKISKIKEHVKSEAMSKKKQGRQPQENISTMLASSSNPTESSDSSFDLSSISKGYSKDSSNSLSLNSDNLNRNAAMLMSSSKTHFSYEELYRSTNGFSDSVKIGEGAFGKVYYSVLRGSKCAIKKLEMVTKDSTGSEKKSGQQLDNEVCTLLSYRHENIVTLYGYAIDGPSLCLIYQHMVNGSLEDCLQCKNGRAPLNWDQRIRIMSGAANGLRFLHKMGDVPLIHGDIKSANILLDRNFEARIGDLGQAQHANSGSVTGQITHITRSCSNTKLYGTKAYLPPEVHRGNYNLSIKFDVFSFGVVLFETCSGESAYDERREPYKFLADYIHDRISDDAEVEHVEMFRDKKAGKPPVDIVLDILNLALTATDAIKKKRPDMDEVVDKLEACQTKWNQVYASLPENQGLSLNLNSAHFSYSSGNNPSVDNMAGNIQQLNKNVASVTSHITLEKSERPYSPIDYFNKEHKSLPEPFRLQMLYDQKRTGDIHEISKEEIELYKNNTEEYAYVSDPKKLAEIEKSDNELQTEDNKNEELVMECDPGKLAKLKLFDSNNMVEESDINVDSTSDNPKLQAILNFDKENIENESSDPVFGMQKSEVHVESESPDLENQSFTGEKTQGEQYSADTVEKRNLKMKRDQFIARYMMSADNDDDDDDECC